MPSYFIQIFHSMILMILLLSLKELSYLGTQRTSRVLLTIMFKIFILTYFIQIIHLMILMQVLSIIIKWVCCV